MLVTLESGVAVGFGVASIRLNDRGTVTEDVDPEVSGPVIEPQRRNYSRQLTFTRTSHPKSGINAGPAVLDLDAGAATCPGELPEIEATDPEADLDDIQTFLTAVASIV